MGGPVTIMDGAMEVTKSYICLRFGAMDVTKPYKFIGLGAMEVTKPNKDNTKEVQQ